MLSLSHWLHEIWPQKDITNNFHLQLLVVSFWGQISFSSSDVDSTWHLLHMWIPTWNLLLGSSTRRTYFQFWCGLHLESASDVDSHLECDLNVDSIWNLPVGRIIFSNSGVDSILDSASDVDSTWYLFHMLITTWNLLVESWRRIQFSSSDLDSTWNLLQTWIPPGIW